MTRRTYWGTTLEVSFEADLCIHATECVRGLPAVFDRGRRPWILSDNAHVDQVSSVVEGCPTGALLTNASTGTPASSPGRPRP